MPARKTKSKKQTTFKRIVFPYWFDNQHKKKTREIIAYLESNNALHHVDLDLIFSYVSAIFAITKLEHKFNLTLNTANTQEMSELSRMLNRERTSLKALAQMLGIGAKSRHNISSFDQQTTTEVDVLNTILNE